MLEPILPHNREEFDRLGARKRRAFIVALASLPFLTLLLVLLARAGIDDTWGFVLIAAQYALLFAIFVVLEVKRTLVFRRDLLERRVPANCAA